MTIPVEASIEKAFPVFPDSMVKERVCPVSGSVADTVSTTEPLTEYSITETEVTQIINEFITAERSEILFYDINTNTYQFNNIFLKAYCKLRFESEKSDEVDIRKRENKIINHLMSVVEIDKNKNLFDIVHSDDFEDFNNEVESYI